jgi:hypothetical protein
LVTLAGAPNVRFTSNYGLAAAGPPNVRLVPILLQKYFGARLHEGAQKSIPANPRMRTRIPQEAPDPVKTIMRSRSSLAASPRKAHDRRGRCRTSPEPPASNACKSVPPPPSRQPGRRRAPAEIGFTMNDYGE